MNAVWNDSGLAVDVGDDPPLVTTDGRSGPPDRRKVSMRWLAGTVLAAMASTSLMGGALYTALAGRQPLERPMTSDGSPLLGGSFRLGDDILVKGDMEVAEPAATARQVLRVSTITRDGDRNIVKAKPFARIASPLIATSAEVVDPVPPFNPLRIFADANTDVDGVEDILYGAAVDGQMAMTVVDFPVDDRSMPATAFLDLDASEMLVRENAGFLSGSPVQVAALPLVDPGRFDFGFAERSSFDQFGVRITPENVSFVATTAEAASEAIGSYTETKTAIVEKGESLEALLTGNEATDEEAGEIALQLRKNFSLRTVEPDDRVRIELAAAGDDTGRYRPIRVSVFRDGQHLGTVALSDHQGYVAAEEPRALGDDLFAQAADEADAGPRPRLYESLYQTSLKNGMSAALIDELVRIFSFDIDFNTRVSPGDRLEVVYSLDEDEREAEDVSEIVFTALTIAGKTRRFYRYKAPDDGSVDYYDEDGKSAKKFLLRKPMSGGTFRSGFGSRRHPLLGYVRAHTGVDWSAPRGTPIMAAGDGEVIYADWKSGYGNYIEISHTNGYVTAYAHQTGFAKGIKKGIRVRQGQVIGYVGSTGLSTGPHLHYEVHVNGTPVDPMRVKLPRGRSLDGDILAQFSAERERIDTLLGGGTPVQRLAGG